MPKYIRQISNIPARKSSNTSRASNRSRTIEAGSPIQTLLSLEVLTMSLLQLLHFRISSEINLKIKWYEYSGFNYIINLYHVCNILYSQPSEKWQFENVLIKARSGS